MKKHMKLINKIVTFVLALTFVFGNVLIVSASANSIKEIDGLEVEIITDNEEYNINEEIEVDIRIKNISNQEIKNISIEGYIPDNFQLMEGYSLTSEIINLVPDEEKTFTYIAIVKSAEGNGETGNNNNNQNTDGHNKNVDNDTNNVIKPESNESNNSGLLGTGDKTIISILLTVFSVSVIGLLVFSKKRKNIVIGTGVFALLLSHNAMTTNLSAEESLDKIEVSKEIIVNNENYEMGATVYYEKNKIELSIINDINSIIDDFHTLNVENYTNSSYHYLKDLISDLENQDLSLLTNEELEIIKTELEDAYGDLVYIKDLRNIISTSIANYELAYTPDSIIELKQSVTSAIIILEKSNATQEEINTAIFQIQTNINNLEVDKRKLIELLETTKELVATDWSNTSYQALLKAVDELELIIEKEVVTLEEVANIYQKVEKALNDLTVDKSNLLTLVTNSSSYVEEDYSNGFTEYQIAWNNANSVLNNENAIQSQIDEQFNLLTTAIGNLVIINHADKTNLEALLNEVSSLQENNYTPMSWTILQNTISNANIVMNNNNATQFEVDDAILAITAAMNSLQNRANFIDLNSTITSAEMLVNGNFTESTLNLLKEKLLTAKIIVLNANATQEEVDQAKNELQSAIDNLIVFVSTSELETKLEQAKNISSDNYTSESYTKLQTAISNAETVLSRSNKTQEEVDAAKDNLVTAINELEEIMTVAKKRIECEERVMYAQTLLSTSQAPTEYVTNLNSRINAMNGMLSFDDNDLTIDELQTVLDSLNASITRYEANLYNLESIISQAQTKLLEAKEINTTNYNDSSVATLNYSIQLLEQRIIEYEAERIMSAITALQSAIDGLTIKDTSVYYNDQAPQEVLDLLNTKRIELGLQPLTLDATLCNVAKARGVESQYQIGAFEDWAHNRPDGSYWTTILPEFGITQAYVGENAAIAYTNGTGLYNAWYNSVGHRENMLDTNYTKVGIAMVKVGNGTWVSYMILSN